MAPPSTPATVGVDQPKNNDAVEGVLYDGNGRSVVPRIPVAHGTPVPVGPIQGPKNQGPVVVVDGNIAERVEHGTRQHPVIEAGGAPAGTGTPGAAVPEIVPQIHDQQQKRDGHRAVEEIVRRHEPGILEVPDIKELVCPPVIKLEAFIVAIAIAIAAIVRKEDVVNHAHDCYRNQGKVGQDRSQQHPRPIEGGYASPTFLALPSPENNPPGQAYRPDKVRPRVHAFVLFLICFDLM